MFVWGERRRSVWRFRNLSSGTEARRKIDSGRAGNGVRVGGELLKGFGNDAGGGKTDLTSNVVDGYGKSEILSGVHFN